jgi:hypothetical protein
MLARPKTPTTYSATDVSSSSAIDDSIEHTEPYEYPAKVSGSYATSRHDEPADAISSSSQFQYSNPDDISWNQFTNTPSSEVDLMNDEPSYTNPTI